MCSCVGVCVGGDDGGWGGVGIGQVYSICVGQGGGCLCRVGVMDFGIGESFSYIFMLFACIFKTYDMIYKSFY